MNSSIINSARDAFKAVFRLLLQSLTIRFVRSFFDGGLCGTSVLRVGRRVYRDGPKTFRMALSRVSFAGGGGVWFLCAWRLDRLYPLFFFNFVLHTVAEFYLTRVVDVCVCVSAVLLLFCSVLFFGVLLLYRCSLRRGVWSLEVVSRSLFLHAHRVVTLLFCLQQPIGDFVQGRKSQAVHLCPRTPRPHTSRPGFSELREPLQSNENGSPFVSRLASCIPLSLAGLASSTSCLTRRHRSRYFTVCLAVCFFCPERRDVYRDILLEPLNL